VKRFREVFSGFKTFFVIVTQLQQTDGIVQADEDSEGGDHSVLPHIKTIWTSRQVETMREIRVRDWNNARE
jgi:hypothetical protein